MQGNSLYQFRIKKYVQARVCGMFQPQHEMLYTLIVAYLGHGNNQHTRLGGKWAFINYMYNITPSTCARRSEVTVYYHNHISESTLFKMTYTMPHRARIF